MELPRNIEISLCGFITESLRLILLHINYVMSIVETNTIVFIRLIWSDKNNEFIH